MVQQIKNILKKPCSHKWKIVVNKELESPYEQLVKQGESLTTLHGTEWGIDLFRKTAIVIMLCDDCGKVDKTFVHSTIRKEL